MTVHTYSIAPTALPVTLRDRVPEVDGEWVVVPDGGVLPEGTGPIIGRLPSGESVYLTDYAGEVNGCDRYDGWIVVSSREPEIDLDVDLGALGLRTRPAQDQAAYLAGEARFRSRMGYEPDAAILLGRLRALRDEPEA